jgi:DNA-binding NtrC family response regulator
MTISDAAMTALVGHSWPGNVRELKNLMQYIAAMCPADLVTAEHVAEGLAPPGATAPPQRCDLGPADPVQFRPIADEVRDLEATRMREAIAACGGNQTRAASMLSMSIRTFYDKAKQYGLSPKKKRDDD